MIKFRNVDISNCNWTSIAGNWSRNNSLFTHNPEGVSSDSFNLYICEKKIQNGAIEGAVRISPGGDNSGRLVFRYGPSGCYYAGVGGYGRHYAIVKQIRSDHGIFSMGLALDGTANDVRLDKPYDLRVEFIDDKITLMSSNVTVLEANDSWFKNGHVGLDTWGQTKVEFFNLKTYEVPPVSELVQILETFPYTLKRDYTYLKKELKNEKDVQRVLWTMLRTYYSDLIDEEILGRFGLKHYQDDFGIPSLATIIEVKVVYEKTDLKNLQESLMTDAVGYLGSINNYRHLVYFIYNKANKQIDSSFISALESIENVAAVLVLPGVKL